MIVSRLNPALSLVNGGENQECLVKRLSLTKVIANCLTHLNWIGNQDGVIDSKQSVAVLDNLAYFRGRP